jgi:hypothetical protein
MIIVRDSHNRAFCAEFNCASQVTPISTLFVVELKFEDRLVDVNFQ